MNMSSYKCCCQSKSESGQVITLSPLLKIVAEENRLKILCILRQGQHCVCQILKHLNLSQSLISHHLKDLKDAGLVTDKKKGQWVHYSLTKKGKKISDLLFTFK